MDSILITSRDMALMKLVSNFCTLFPDLQVRPYEVIDNEDQYADIFLQSVYTSALFFVTVGLA